MCFSSTVGEDVCLRATESHLKLKSRPALGLVELFYGALSLLPTFFPPLTLQSASGGGQVPSSQPVIDPLSGDAFIPVPVPTTTAPSTTSGSGSSIPATTQPTSTSLLAPIFGHYPSPTSTATQISQGPVSYPWILRVPSRSTDLLALAAACFGGIPSIIFWVRGVGRGGGEDPSARDYAVGALVGTKARHCELPFLD